MSETIYAKADWHGLQAYVLRNTLYEAIILPDYGANCISLCHLPTGTQLLRGPKGPEDLIASPYVYGLPILFPPNRIRSGEFVFQGRTYSFPINNASHGSHIHGVLAKIRFEPCGEAAFCYEATNESPYLSFPHTFRFERRYMLTDEGLAHEIVVTNTSSQDMPLAVGLHSAFNISEGETLHLPVHEQILLEPDTFVPTGETMCSSPLINALREGTLAPESHSLSHQFALDPGEWIIHRDIVTICFEPDSAFRFIMLWNQGGGRGFVCPEPQSCAVNAFKGYAPAEETGVYALKPGETRHYKMHFRAVLR